VVQVLKEPGKTPQSKSRMWVYCTGRAGPFPIVLYEYKPCRGGKNAKEFLAGAGCTSEGVPIAHMSGVSGFFLQTDAYSGYNMVENAIHCHCWAHLRRRFNEAMPKSPKKDNLAYIGLRHCQKLFDLEREYEELSAGERHAMRQKESKPVLDDFFAWVEAVNPLAGSKLAEAVNYAKNQKQTLMNFLLDGNIEISTNRVENAIRPFALGRKNFLFADTVAGADASAVAYSIVETAKANSLNPYEYLLYLFTELPSVLSDNPFADLSPFFPWAAGVKDRCRNLKLKLERDLIDSSGTSHPRGIN
jgi:hypothetical protein